MSIVESKFGFFEVKVKSFFRNSVKLGKSSFSKAPKRLYTIDVGLASCEFIFAVLYSEVLGISHVNQAIVAWPSV